MTVLNSANGSRSALSVYSLSNETPKSANSTPELLAILQRRRRLALGVFCGVVISGGVITLLQRLFIPVYEGSFRLMVSDPLQQARAENTAQVDAAANVINPAFNIKTPELIEVLSSPLLIAPLAKRLGVDPIAVMQNLRIRTPSREVDGVLDVSLKWQNPQKGELLLQGLSREYLNFSLRQRQQRLNQGLALLDQQAPDLQKRVAIYQHELARFRQGKGFLDPTKKAETIQADRQELSSRLAQLEQQNAQLVGLAAAVKNGHLSGSQFQRESKSSLVNGSDQPLAGGAFSQLLQDLTDIEKQLAEAQSTFNNNYPLVQSLVARRNSLRPLLQKRELDAISSALSQNLAQQQQIKASDLSLQKQFSENPMLIKTYDSLQQRLEVARDNLTSYIKARENYRLEVAQKMPVWQLISAPEFNANPVSPSLSRNLLLAVLLGSMAGLGSAVARDWFDRVFHHATDAERDLQLPLLTALPSLRITDGETTAQVLARLDPIQRRALENSLDTFVSTLRQRRSNQTIHSFALTSATTGEGKTTTLSLLASNLAEHGHRVLLVDADLHHPGLHQLHGVANKVGLSDLLTTESMAISDVVLHINPRIDLIPAGSCSGSSLRLLGTDACGERFRQITALSGYDMVLVDTPEALGRSAAQMVATHLDGIVLLARLQGVDRSKLHMALRRLRDSGLSLLGLVTTHERELSQPERPWHEHSMPPAWRPWLHWLDQRS